MKRTVSTRTLFALLLLLWSSHYLRAEGPDLQNGQACRNHDDVWLVSTRGISCPCNELQASDLRVTHRVENEWHISSAAEYQASLSDHAATVIYVHGNRMDGVTALQRGLALYRKVIHSCSANQHVRFVIWSWPSDKSGGLLHDVRVKARRTNLESDYLAFFLKQVPQHSATSLVGYSFGARIITGALHSLNHTRATKMPVVRVALLAAAVDTDWLNSGCHHAGALERAAQVLLFFNPVDPALKRYHFVNPHSHPDALGYTGFRHQVAARPDVKQLDVSQIIGRSHGEMRYYGSHAIRDRLRPFLLWQAPQPAIAEP